MVTIGKGRDVMTLINVFTVQPEKQQALVDLLIEATDQTMKAAATLAAFDPIVCEVVESIGDGSVGDE